MRIGAVTIIIPCYKAAATLRRAVDSTLCGAPADTRLLLVDDGSPDSTGTLCDELASADPRITALHRANGGAGAARSTGLDAATGDWVLFLDADDELLPGLWDELAALDDTAQKADLLLFHLCRASGGDTTGVLAPGFYPDLSALGAALEPLLFTSGLLAARSLYARLEGKALPTPPADTMCGFFNESATTENKHFQPMGANMGILPPLPEESRPRDKRLRYMAQAQRAVASFQHWLDETSL